VNTFSNDEIKDLLGASQIIQIDVFDTYEYAIFLEFVRRLNANQPRHENFQGADCSQGLECAFSQSHYLDLMEEVNGGKKLATNPHALMLR
jgi:hypothetical protein